MNDQFSDFYQSLDADPVKRGKQFEHFIKWFLKNEPEWSTQVDQVWLWDEYPGRWGVDCGIDLIFTHHNGEIWAVQAKCYASEHHITKHDVDKFLSESNRQGIDKRLLIATTDHIGANAKQVCDAQEKTVVRYLLSSFETAKIEYPARFEDLPRAKRNDPPKPRQHQVEAISAVTRNFIDAERGQLIMACGTGKTFTTLWIKEALEAKQTLVLLPSLGLLSQTLKEWTFAANHPFDVLCVCSDETVGRKGEDEAITSVTDLAFPVTSDVSEIRRFLKGDSAKVVFSTYQSSPLVSAAQEIETIPAFDLVIADEAHRCAGKVDSAFSTVLDRTSIRAAKRLFATATPRTYSTSVTKAAEGRGVEVIGMDDEEVFGKVLYTLPFGEAISRGLLTDYRVVIIGVDDPTIKEWIERGELVETPSGTTGDAESLSGQIGLLKAINDYDLKRVISFHSRVKRADGFSSEIQQVLKWISIEDRPSGQIWSDFVSGAMRTDRRRQKLDHLKALGVNERGVLANARCLSEGVDVPSLDGVAFIDPRSSQVDIVQAVGRAIRLSPDKKVGTIVLPVFIKEGDSAEASIDNSNFKPVWDVLNALKAHDDVLSFQLDQIRTELGRKPGSRIDPSAFSKIAIDLPSSVDASFGDSLRTILVERSTESWNFWYGLMQEYAQREGHCRVAGSYETKNGFRLGAWVNTQRIREQDMPQVRRARLEALPGWTWGPLADKWEAGFRYLREYVQQEGHCRISRGYKTADGYPLEAWTNSQRQRKADLSQEYKARLEVLPGWSWDPLADQWERGFRNLQEFIRREGHGRVPDDYRTSDDYRLGLWVRTQRGARAKMTQERRMRLESLPDWTWDRLDQWWEDGFKHLQEFTQKEGHCKVNAQHKTQDGYFLGRWVTHQRKSKDKIPQVRRVRLESLTGWSWDPLAEQWEEGFKYLRDYIHREGNCKVPARHKMPDGFQLGSWVANKRRRKDDLSQERRELLEALPGWTWDPLAEWWEEGFKYLQDYVHNEGSCRVPNRYKTADGYRLGGWVSKQRERQDKTSQERRARLEALPGWEWKVRQD